MNFNAQDVASDGDNVLIPRKLLPRSLRCPEDSLDQLKDLLSAKAWRALQNLGKEKIGDFAGWGPWDFREQADCSDETAEELFRIICFPEKVIRLDEKKEPAAFSADWCFCCEPRDRKASGCAPARLAPQLEGRNNLLGPAVLRPDVRREWELSKLIFSTRARSALDGLGCKTVGDAAREISEWADLMRLNSCGETTANEIWDKLFAPNGSLETKVRMEGDDRPAPTLPEFLEKFEKSIENPELSEPQRKSQERRLFAFKRRLDGLPLRKIAGLEGQDCSTEMVRQRIEKTLDECPHLREDEYLEDFQKAGFGEFDFCQEFGVPRSAYYFLVMRTKRPRPQKPAFSKVTHERMQTVLDRRFPNGYSPTETFAEFKTAWSEELAAAPSADFPDGVVKEALDRYSVRIGTAEKAVYWATRRLLRDEDVWRNMLSEIAFERRNSDDGAVPCSAFGEKFAESWKRLGVESPLIQRKILKLTFGAT